MQELKNFEAQQGLFDTDGPPSQLDAPPMPGPRPRVSILRRLFGGRISEVEDARDAAYFSYIESVGGFESLVSLVQQHARIEAQREMERDEALLVIEGWRRYGVIRQMSIGEYLDEYHQASASAQ